MTTKDFENFKVSVNLSIELDCVMRSITEKLKFVHASHNHESLRRIIDFLRASDEAIDTIITKELCEHETEN